MLFDKICRKNAITHRLTAPASPNQNGKVERFHLTLRRELLDDHQPYLSVTDAQAAVDEFVTRYNTDRPHQALDERAPVMPADRFRPVPQTEQELLELWLPPHLAPAEPSDHDADVPPVRQSWAGGPIEFDRIVPPSGNLQVAGKQFWLGPQRAGQSLRFWADVNLIHLLVAGARIKTVRSHLTVNDLARLVADGATNAGPSPLPQIEGSDAIEVERIVARGGTVALAGQVLLAAEILGGRRVEIRIEPSTLVFYDLDTRELLRVRSEPAHHGPGPPTARQPARRAAATPIGRTGPSAAPRVELRRDHGLRPEGLPRP